MLNTLPSIPTINQDTLKYVPSFGWAMYFVGMVFLKRRSSEDRDRMTRAMEFIKQAQLPVWLVNYPEGSVKW